MHIEYEIHGADSTAIRIRAVGEELRARIKQALSDAVNAAEREMKAYFDIHRDSGRTRLSIRKSGIIYSPGGAGGGGFFQVELSVGEGVPYFNIFVEGSGEHGVLGTRIVAGKGNIRPKGNRDWLPRTGADFMKLPPKLGYPIYHKSVRGQHAHDAWINLAHEAADAVIRESLDRISI